MMQSTEMRRLVIAMGLLLLAGVADASWLFGPGDTVSVTGTSTLTLPAADWALSGWVRLPGPSTSTRTIFRYNTTQPYMYLKVYGSGTYPQNNLYLGYMGSAAASSMTIFGGTPGTVTDWQLFTVRRASNALNVYIGSTCVGSTKDMSFQGAFNADVAWVWGDGTAFEGYLCEWAKWDRALSVGDGSELATLAAGGKPEEATGGAPVWHLDMYDGFDCQLGGLTVTNNGAMTAPWTHSVSGRTPAAVPHIATTPFPADTATGAGYRLPHLRWVDPAGGAATFNVYLDTNADPTTLVANNITVPYCTLASNLSMNTTYHWKVVSTNANGSVTSSVWSFTTWDFPAGTKWFASPSGTGDGTTEVSPMAWSSVSTGTSPGDAVYIVSPDDTIYNPDAVWVSGRAYYAEKVTANNDDESWLFDRYYRVGQFCNGDIWVDGPVNIIAITPVWDGDIHGTMINPSGGDTHGFRDTGTYISTGYRGALNVMDESRDPWPTHGLPLAVNATSSVITAYGLTTAVDYQHHKSMGILTVLANPASEGAFRPPVVGGTSKAVAHNESALNYSVLGTLTGVGAPTLHKDAYADKTDWDETLERSLQRYHMSWGASDLYRQALSAYTHEYYYPMDTASLIGCAALALNCNYTNAQKRLLLCRMVQLGIDEYAIRVASNGGYSYGEGHAGAHAFPVLFAAAVLNDPNMYANVLASKQDERSQYFYVSESTDVLTPDPTNGYALSTSGGTIAKIWSSAGAGTQTGPVTVTNGSTTVTLNSGSWSGGVAETYFFGVVGDNRAFDPRGHVYVVSGTPSGSTITLTEAYDGATDANASYVMSDCLYYGHGKGGKQDSENNYRYDYPEYVGSMVGLPEYGSFHFMSPLMAGPFWGFPGCMGTYRWSSAEGNGGMALSILIMGLVDEWGCNEYLDYMDRHYEYTSRILSLDDHTGIAVNDLWYSGFERSMWAEYRDDYAAVRPIWTHHAKSPYPADGATGVSCTPTLSWAETTGTYGVQLYLGTSAVLGGGDCKGVVTAEQYSPTLIPDTTYYWRVDYVDTSDYPVPGTTWSFTTGVGSSIRPTRMNGWLNGWLNGGMQ